MTSSPVKSQRTRAFNVYICRHLSTTQQHDSNTYIIPYSYSFIDILFNLANSSNSLSYLTNTKWINVYYRIEYDFFRQLLLIYLLSNTNDDNYKCISIIKQIMLSIKPNVLNVYLCIFDTALTIENLVHIFVEFIIISVFHSHVFDVILDF